jgi:Mg2+/Co2+ transporter CorB
VQRRWQPLVAALEGARALVMRLLRIRERHASTRQIVEGLRAVIEESQREQTWPRASARSSRTRWASTT